jgi:Predicted 3'-5' exonuclease related to the exonuclease domain of PolB
MRIGSEENDFNAGAVPTRGRISCGGSSLGSNDSRGTNNSRSVVGNSEAPGLAARPYFNRYTEAAIDLCDIDLCDVLSSFSSHAKTTLHELCRVMGLPGKEGMRGDEVEKYYRDCMDGNAIPLTQEFLGQMLGVRRTTVTIAARLL